MPEDSSLRDQLAIDRTLLANERTLLAYLRFGIALLIAGVTIMHFSTEGWFWSVGLASIPTGLFTTLIGIQRFRRMHTAINQSRRQLAHATKEEAAQPPG